MMRSCLATSMSAASFADPSAFKSAMRELVGAVGIVTAGRGDERRGLTVTAFCSLSVDPPSLIVCVNKATEGHAAILQHGSFCLNVVGDEHRPFADCFAGRTELRGVDRFSQGRWSTAVTGAPVLVDAIAALDCDVLDSFDRDTHTVFIGGARAVRSAPDRAALIYRTGEYQVVRGTHQTMPKRSDRGLSP